MKLWRAPSTAPSHATSAACASRSFLDDRSVHEIDADALKDLIKQRRRAGVKNATIRRDLTALASVLNHAADEGWIKESPVAALNLRGLRPSAPSASSCRPPIPSRSFSSGSRRVHSRCLRA